MTRKEVRYEHWCPDYRDGCKHTWDSDEHYEEKCPKCGQDVEICHTPYITCDCGCRVYLDRFTNQCMQCGKYYNGFGEELADPDEWDPEDRYDCFGPQGYDPEEF